MLINKQYHVSVCAYTERQIEREKTGKKEMNYSYAAVF